MSGADFFVSQALARWVVASLDEANDFAREGLPPFDAEALFGALAREPAFVADDFSVALVGLHLNAKELQKLADAAGLGGLAALDVDLHVATSWRNERANHRRIVALATGYNPSVHGLGFFGRASSSELATHLLKWAGGQLEFSATPAQQTLLTVLATEPRLSGLRTIDGVAAFLDAWRHYNGDDKQHGSRQALVALGLLSDPQLYEADDLTAQLQRNISLSSQLKELAPSELQQRRRNAAKLKDGAQQAEQFAAIERVEHYRLGLPDSGLTLQDAELILRPTKERVVDEPLASDDTSDGEAIVREATEDVRDVAAEALLDDREEDLVAIAEGLDAAWADFDDGDDTLVTTIQLRDGAITMEEPIDGELLAWVRSFCSPENWGGWFETTTPDLRQALNRASETTPIFTDPLRAFRAEDGRDYSVAELLAGWDENENVEAAGRRPLAEIWTEFVGLRTRLCGHLPQLLFHARESLDGGDALRQTCDAYLRAASELYDRVTTHYRDAAEDSPDWAQATLEILLSLDIVQVRVDLADGRSSLKAVMLPLHPLHLWRYQRLTEILRGFARKSLTDHERKALLIELRRPEHFLSVLRLGGAPDGKGHNQLLPVANDIGGLATFENLHNAVSSGDGIETLLRAIDHYILLYPNHPRPLRVAIINPPEPARLLERLISLLDDRRYSVAALPTLRLELFATEQHRDRLIAAAALSSRIQDVVQEKVAAGRLDLAIDLDSPPVALEPLIERLSGRPFHVLALFDEASIRMAKRRLGRLLPMSPFCVRNEIVVDKRFGHIKLEPRAGDPPFSHFLKMIEELGQGQRDSTTIASADAEALRGVVDRLLNPDAPIAQWVMLADRALPSEVGMRSVRLLAKQENRRHVLLNAADYGRLLRLMRRAFSQCNLSVNEETLASILREGAGLVGGGLLDMLKKQDGQPDNSKVLGFAGMLLAARDLRDRYPDSLVVSVDIPLARLWLELGERMSNERCDLLVVQRLAPGEFRIVCAEVKTTGGTEISPEDQRLAQANTQVGRTLNAIRDALDGRDGPQPLDAPKSEMLKEILVRAAAVNYHGNSPERRTLWGGWLKELFGQEGDRPVIKVEGEVSLVLLRASGPASSNPISGHSVPVTLRKITEPRAETLLAIGLEMSIGTTAEVPAVPALRANDGAQAPRFPPPEARQALLPDTVEVSLAADRGDGARTDTERRPPPTQPPALTVPASGKVDETAWPPPVNSLGMIGQIQVARDLVNQALQARGWDERFLDKLFVGPAGVGKSTLARKIGEVLLGVETILFNGADLRRPDMIIERLVELEKAPSDAQGEVIVSPCLIFIDEVHAISAGVATALLSALDDRRTTTIGNVVYRFDQVVFLLATTDPGKLTEAFLSRPDRTVLPAYTLHELAGIVWLHAREMLDNADLSQATCYEIAARQRCNPRPSVNILRPLVAAFYGEVVSEAADAGVQRVPTRAEIATRMTPDKVAEWFEAQGVDLNGLDAIARSYLQALRTRGAMSEDELRRALRISNRGDFIEVSEYLTRLRLIQVGPGGRTLTSDGRSYLSRPTPPNLRDRIVPATR